MVPDNSPKWNMFSQRVVDSLEKLHADLLPDTHVAFVMWTPGMPECEAVITSGSESELIEAVQRRIAKG
jgi:hypothetical protein